MNKLIRIEKKVIGADTVNAVNARELYEALEIKQQFTNWVDKQIKRAGLRVNVDYIVTNVKVTREIGSSTRKEYILTTDSSKHIAMMSQGQKAKEVRDYFIAIEKEYRQNENNTGNDILNQIVPVLQNMIEMMSLILENQAKQTQTVAKPSFLSPEQLGKIRGAVNETVIPVMQYYKEEDENITRKIIYTKLNNRMGVPSYIYIPAHAFEEAVTILENAKERYEKKIEARKEMKLDINMSV